MRSNDATVVLQMSKVDEDFDQEVPPDSYRQVSVDIPYGHEIQ